MALAAPDGRPVRPVDGRNALRPRHHGRPAPRDLRLDVRPSIGPPVQVDVEYGVDVLHVFFPPHTAVP